MKRFLGFVIALALLAAALSGCAAEQGPTNGANSSMFMTIVETRPSGSAFEYRGPGQPYCFYAYDLEGKFYRVLWDMPWEGLHEKDLILVAYTGEIREIDEWKLDGGYTPQYEIIATRVQPEREVLAACLIHGDDGYTLTLPKSGKTLTLTEEQVRFLPYITDELVAEAENKLAQEAAGYGNNSGFYLQINEGYLCLVCEVIHDTEAPDGSGHEHLFYEERISDRAVKTNAKPGPAYTESSVIYCSGAYKIYAMSTLLWSRQENADGSFTETTVDTYDIVDLVNGKTHIPLSDLEIPTLRLDGAVTPLVPANGEIEGVSLLVEGENGFVRNEYSFEELADLTPGTYYVVVSVGFAGSCDPDVLPCPCRFEDVFRLEVGEPSHSGYETGVELLQYNWDGYGIGRKTLSCTDVGYAIMDALKAMQETGETAPKLSDDVLDKSSGLSGELPVPRGTMWIEAEGLIYRLTPDLSQICRVETHFGEGAVLEMSDSFKTDVSNAWQYAPFDYYKGTCHSGDKTVELTNVFAASSSVELRIVSIQIEKTANPRNKITVELLSSVDQTAAIKLHCQQSDDNHALGDGKTVGLREGVAETVELTFGGWEDCRYWVYLMVDNTMAEITIEP